MLLSEPQGKLHCPSLHRIQKATESLKTFQPSAHPSFDEFQVDTSKEEAMLKDLTFGGGTIKPVWPFSTSQAFETPD